MQLPISERVRILLESKNISQGAFAKQIGLAQTLINRTVLGKSMPSFDAIEKIYRAFPGLSGRWLLTGEGEMWEDGQKAIHQVAVGNGNHQVATLDQCRDRVVALEERVRLLEDLVQTKEEVIRLMKQN